MKLSKTLKIIGLMLAIMALVLFAAPSLNPYVGLFILFISGWLFFLEQPKLWQDDINLLYHMAKESPSGVRDLPEWKELKPEGRGWERYENFFFAVFRWKGFRWKVILDSYLGPGHSLIDTKMPISNKVSISDVRDMVIKKAYGYRRILTAKRVYKWVEDHGGKIVWNKNSIMRGGPESVDNDIDLSSPSTG